MRPVGLKIEKNICFILFHGNEQTCVSVFVDNAAKEKKSTKPIPNIQCMRR
jgi:hypothetical protein